MKRFTLSVFVWQLASLVAIACSASENDLLDQARAAAVRGESAQAVRLASAAIEGNPQLADAYYLRGREHFRLGNVDKSVADFDRFVGLKPTAAPRQWERGIALYYARQYKQGAQQFELYQTYHDNDVENSVWRYLCMVPTVGVQRAREAMLPIQNDRRPGMMQVYDLFRGKLKPPQMLSEFQTGNPPPQQLAGRLFYAHLYLGLYYESLGEKPQAEKYIRLAAAPQLAANPYLNSYMWDVARIHMQRLTDKVSDKQPDKQPAKKPSADTGKAR